MAGHAPNTKEPMIANNSSNVRMAALCARQEKTLSIQTGDPLIEGGRCIGSRRSKGNPSARGSEITDDTVSPQESGPPDGPENDIKGDRQPPDSLMILMIPVTRHACRLSADPGHAQSLNTPECIGLCLSGAIVGQWRAKLTPHHHFSPNSCPAHDKPMKQWRQSDPDRCGSSALSFEIHPLVIGRR